MSEIGVFLIVLSTLCPPMQSQGALAGRLRSFSMQDLRSLPDQAPVHFQDPLYLEEQESLRQPLGEELGGVTVRGGSSEAHGGRAGSWRVPPVPSLRRRLPLRERDGG